MILHAGNTISDLYARVDNALELARRKRLEEENQKLCHWCRQTQGEHSFEGSYCPSMREFGPLYRMTQFREIRCQAGVGRHENVDQCNRECIPGIEFCPLHSQEE